METALEAGPVQRTSLAEGLAAVFMRDVRIALARRSDTLAALLFFVMVASLFPLGVGPEPALLQRMGPGVVWVAALLASMLSLNRMFADDWQDGTLEQMALGAHPLAFIVLAKVAAHWLSSGLLLTAAAPLIALQYNLPADAIGLLVVSLLLGTPVLSLLGAIGAALTAGVRGGGVLVALLVLPLAIPVLIFGAGSVESQLAGLDPMGHLSLLAALLAAGLALTPVATAAALRIALE